MEVRDFKGCFVLDGRDGEEMDLRVILSTGGGGVTSGSGSFALPMALVGRAGEVPLTFRLTSGETLRILVREIDLADGLAYFLTEGAVPEGASVARRA
jgi:hypothetical protein